MRSSDDSGLVVGVDTHRDTHTAAVCDRAGKALAARQFTAGPGGYAALLARARQQAAHAGGLAGAIEGTRHYGPGLARHLTAAGEQVREIDASRHAGQRRNGKSDAIDAIRAARELLARPAPRPMRVGGDREALRLLMCGRDNAVASARPPARCWPGSLSPRPPLSASSCGTSRATAAPPCAPA